jgi:hypothetical protein
MLMLIWLLFVAFLCNDGEELLTAEAWIRKNPDKYKFAPERLRLDPERSLTAQMAVAIAVVGAAMLTVTVVGARTYTTTGHLHPLFIAALALILLDGVKHILLSIGLRGYSSGVVSAVLVQVPYSVYAFQRFFAAGLLTWGEVLRCGVVGVLLIGPLLGLGFALAKRVVPRAPAQRSA